MPVDREPLLEPVEIQELRPTQMTVGYREVERKRKEWHTKSEKDGKAFLGRHMIPVILDEKGRRWMIDQHHLVRALHEEGVTHVLTHIIADLSMVRGRLFRTFMENRNWLHPFDAAGRRQKSADIPRHIGELADDPYRSLAGELRRLGGYAKVDVPFSEFLWADFLRRHIKAEQLQENFSGACEAALSHARKPQASYLPGWAGPRF
jgi:hypothetical protein